MMSSGKICSVFGCINNAKNTSQSLPKISFYRFPNRAWENSRRTMWINFVKRKNIDGSNWEPNQNSRICSEHFFQNCKSQNSTSPSYNPTIRPDMKNKLQRNSQKQARFERAEKRQRTEVGINVTAFQQEDTQEEIIESKREIGVQTDDDNSECGNLTVFLCCTTNNISETYVSHVRTSNAETNTNYTNTCDRKCGPDKIRGSFEGYESVMDKEDALMSLAGVTVDVLSFLLGLLPSHQKISDVSWPNRLLIFLMKLKLGISYSALGALFEISRSTASRIFNQILIMVFLQTQDWIFWPTKRVVKSQMPNCFNGLHENTRVIIDCTEIRTEKPSGVRIQAYMYSQYKGTFTAKYLIGMTPSGFICFLSKGYGGRATDSFITNDSGFLDKLEVGDEVMADKGFPQIIAAVKEKEAIMVMPPFANRERLQFSEEEMMETYKIASVQIHVERIIQRIKVFGIVKNRLPILLLPSLDKIMHVCCVLVNLQSDIIKESA